MLGIIFSQMLAFSLSRIVFFIALSLVATGVFDTKAFALPYTDIEPSDAYYDDVRTLYEQGIISDNFEHRFYPQALIRRDDFTAIVMEVGCTNCRTPGFDLVSRYVRRPFPDVSYANENFYCISEANSQGIVQGYILGPDGTTACQNGAVYSESPFCVENAITRIEATALLLRQADLWDDARNADPPPRRYDLSDVSDYWYAYAERAIDFDMIAVDEEGRIFPDEYLTRADFARMAARTLATSLCEYRDIEGDADERFSKDRE